MEKPMLLLNVTRTTAKKSQFFYHSLSDEIIKLNTPINILQHAYYIIYENCSRYFWYLGTYANDDRKNMNIRTQSDVFNLIL